MSEKIKNFIKRWESKGREKQDTQTFWIELLTEVLEVEDATKRIDFEKTVKIKGDDGKEHTKFIDGYIPETKVLIEQKDAKLSLKTAYKMSGTDRKYTPYEQGDRYGRHLNQKEVPRYIVACNFKEIEVHDNNHRGEPPQIIKLKDLEHDYTRLSFLVNSKNEHLEREKELSVKAGQLVGKIYNALLKMYNDPKEEKAIKSLNVLIVRLVFLLYSEDAGIFKRQQFLNYMDQFKNNPGLFRRELLVLFDILDTPIDERDPYIEEELAEFPYINGGLFNKNLRITIPNFSEEAINLILTEAAAGFDWQGISPTIFGAAFESTLNPETRRSGGMHYTSLENIHKVIDPLFLDDLKKEFNRIKNNTNENLKNYLLEQFIKKLSNLNFFDPACGSGNFLTETYIELRRLENKSLNILNNGQSVFVDINLHDPIKVNLNQFYGIEINDFAVAVANTALFISEYQMLKETEAILSRPIEYLPLRSFNGIHEGNALRMDWNTILPSDQCNYIMGNPPFVGTKLMEPQQRKDREIVFDSSRYGKLDYVSCWFKKAAEYMKNTFIEAAFVSTNSICQGEQVPLLWKLLLHDGLVINFCYRTFQWDNESKEKAHIHCIIIGFSYKSRKDKWIFDKNSKIKVEHINAYLVDAPNIFVEKTQKPLFGAPAMTKGSQLIDGGFYVFSEKEKDEFIKKYPQSKPYFYEYVNADSFLNNRKKKFCLCLKNCPEEIIKKCPGIYERVKKVYEYRANSKAQSTNQLKDRPKEFFITNIPSGDSMLFPIVSSEKRRYIPIGFIKEKTIYTNAINYVDFATLYDFGIFISNVHMAWMRMLAGRLKSDYRYSKDLVYNTFPLPNPSQKQKLLIEKTAQNILDIRNKYSDSSLATLYDEMLMPEDLRKAHRINDKAVMGAYGWKWSDMSEEDCIAELMKIYQNSYTKKR